MIEGCNHPRINFGDSGKIIFCTGCPAIWRADEDGVGACEHPDLGTNVYRVDESWIRHEPREDE